MVGATSSENFPRSVCFTLKLAQNDRIEQPKSTKCLNLAGIDNNNG